MPLVRCVRPCVPTLAHRSTSGSTAVQSTLDKALGATREYLEGEPWTQWTPPCQPWSKAKSSHLRKKDRRSKSLEFQVEFLKKARKLRGRPIPVVINENVKPIFDSPEWGAFEKAMTKGPLHGRMHKAVLNGAKLGIPMTKERAISVTIHDAHVRLASWSGLRTC